MSLARFVVSGHRLSHDDLARLRAMPRVAHVRLALYDEDPCTPGDPDTHRTLVMTAASALRLLGVDA